MSETVLDSAAERDFSKSWLIFVNAEKKEVSTMPLNQFCDETNALPVLLLPFCTNLFVRSSVLSLLCSSVSSVYEMSPETLPVLTVQERCVCEIHHFSAR